MAPRMTITYDDVRPIDPYFIPTEPRIEPVEMSLADLLRISQYRRRAVERYGWDLIVELMREPGAQLAYQDEKGDSVLHYAYSVCVNNTQVEEMMSSYLSQDDCQNLTDSQGLTYLHIACARTKLELVLKFLNILDVDVNVQTHADATRVEASYTPLHFAVEYHKLDIAACLLNNGASIYIRDENGSTPVHLACYDPLTKMIDLLLFYDRISDNSIDSSSTSHFMAACMSSNAHFVEQFLINAVLPESLLSGRCLMGFCEGYTPLHFAVRSNRLKIVKILLAYGADCCSLTSRGESPSEIADTYSYVEVGKVIKEHCENYHGKVCDPTREYLNLKETDNPNDA